MGSASITEERAKEIIAEEMTKRVAQRNSDIDAKLEGLTKRLDRVIESLEGMMEELPRRLGK